MRSITRLKSEWILVGFTYKDDKKYGLLSWIGYRHSDSKCQAYYISSYNTAGLSTTIIHTQYSLQYSL